ncbi:MAG TPA: prolyl oligopeptidase family serine peptidase, partial [bacterium]|nr:prolyl oligopeptidase family serine peptidase [bacterium]
TGSRSAHALFYRPKNRDFVEPPGARPPLLVLSHGGPTSATSATFSPEIQFFTSRGFAVVDVNYGGSTGYGRDYRDSLRGAWGVVDVDDCIAAARHLVERGEADGARLCIRGGSAGGYTTLCALTFRHGFAAGASYYGVSDLESLAKDTHKFEARYLDQLVGPYPARKDLYVARSPIAHVEKLSTPVIFLQGLDDRVVPPDQSSRMHAALKAKGIPTALLTFEGEGHGFDRADSIKRAIEAELYFYGAILGFTPPGVTPVAIDNDRRR